MSWISKYELLLKEKLITKDIQALLGGSHNKAKEFRINLVAKLNLEGIELSNNMEIPTELFLKEINRDLRYYETKMMQEHRLNKLKGEA